MLNNEILSGEEAYFWHTITKASELYEQYGEIVIEYIKKDANKCGCQKSRDCCSSLPESGRNINIRNTE